MIRHILQTYKDMAKIFDMLYWPLVDITLMGFTALWFQNNIVNNVNLGFMLLSGIILWGVIWRSNIDVSLNFLEELWSKNLVNLFSTPLSLAEWIVGMMTLGFIRSLLVFFYGSFLVWFFYSWNVFSLGYVLIPFFILLMISGWCIGFFIASFLAYYGLRVQALVWAIGWVFSIFGAVYYPMKILPSWVQVICKALPISYVLEGMRMHIETGLFPGRYIAIAAVLNVFYLSASLLFFRYMFNISRSKGLAYLEID
jgi:ABC-2 type transport system permease protein